MATLQKRTRKQRELYSVGYSPRKKQKKTEHQKLVDLYKRGAKSIRIRLQKLIGEKKRAKVKGPDQVFFRKWLKQSAEARTRGFGKLIEEKRLKVTKTKIYSHGGSELNDDDVYDIVNFILARGIDDEDERNTQKAQIEAGVLPEDEDIVDGVREYFESTYSNKYTYVGLEKRLQDYNKAIDIVMDLDERKSGKIIDKLHTWMKANKFTDFCDIVNEEYNEKDDREDDNVSCESTLLVSSDEESATDNDDSDDESSIVLADFMPSPSAKDGDTSTAKNEEMSTYDRIKSLSGIRIAALQSKINEVIIDCDQIMKDHRRANERMRKEYLKEERRKNAIDRQFVPIISGGIQPTEIALEVRKKHERAQEIKERYKARVARIQAAKDAKEIEEAEESAEEDLTFDVPERWQGAPSYNTESPLNPAAIHAWSTLATDNALVTPQHAKPLVTENTDEQTHIRTSQARV